ncbi:MAG: hypothetical protein ABIV50_05405 [Opitutus sp.]
MKSLENLNDLCVHVLGDLYDAEQPTAKMLQRFTHARLLIN